MSLPYNIKPFKDEVLCDVSPLEVCDVLLDQPYLWKFHVVYESRPHSVIITLDKKLYRIPKVVPPTSIFLDLFQAMQEGHLSDREVFLLRDSCVKVRRRLSPHPWPSHRASLCNRSKWIRIMEE
jgi:hypothetical protein